MYASEQEDTRTTDDPRVELRPIEPADADAAARTVYEAAGIHDHHRFPRDFQTLESAAQLMSNFIAHPAIWGVVAESDGRIVGSNFLDERGPIRGVGPITVDPDAQARRVGRRLMEAVIDRGAGARGIRLLQDAFNTRSMSLYASLGFETREPVVVMGGRPHSAPPAAVRGTWRSGASSSSPASSSASPRGAPVSNRLRAQVAGVTVSRRAAIVEACCGAARVRRGHVRRRRSRRGRRA